MIRPKILECRPPVLPDWDGRDVEATGSGRSNEGSAQYRTAEQLSLNRNEQIQRWTGKVST